MWTAGRGRAVGWLLVVPAVLLGEAGLWLDAADGWPDVLAGPPTLIGALNGVVLSVLGALVWTASRATAPAGSSQ